MPASFSEQEPITPSSRIAPSSATGISASMPLSEWWAPPAAILELLEIASLTAAALLPTSARQSASRSRTTTSSIVFLALTYLWLQKIDFKTRSSPAMPYPAPYTPLRFNMETEFSSRTTQFQMSATLTEAEQRQEIRSTHTMEQ